MKHKVSELDGALLDAAVAKADGVAGEIDTDTFGNLVFGPMNFDAGEVWSPRNDWAIGGPIIERERICLQSPDIVEMELGRGQWWAGLPGKGIGTFMGSTPLIAAMRAYVASKFGEEAELP